LIVEDEDPVRELLAEYLRGRGAEVTDCATAAAGMRALADSSFDLLVTDLKLPDGEGMDLVRSARTRPHPPVSGGMSGYATVEDAVAVLTGGAMDLVLKPFRLRDAYAALGRAIQRGTEEREQRFSVLVARWLEAAASAESQADGEALLPALASLVAAWKPGSRLEVGDVPAPEGWTRIGRRRSACVLPGDPRAEAWLRALHACFVRLGI